MCESDERGRRGVEGVAVKREVKTMIHPLFSTTSSPLKTHHTEMEKRSDVTVSHSKKYELELFI